MVLIGSNAKETSLSSQKNGERKRQVMKRSACLEVKVRNQKLFNIKILMCVCVCA